MEEQKKNDDIMKDIFEPIKNDPNYDEFMKNFKLKAPVKKINLDVNQPNTIVGLWLLADESSLDLLKEKADMTDTDDNTIIAFTNQHIIELSNIIYGMSLLFVENNILPKEDLYKFISGYLTLFNQISTYGIYKENLRISGYTESERNIFFGKNRLNGKVAKDKFIDVLKYIIFVSYADLDEIAKKAIEEFKESQKGNDNNEG